VRGEREIRRGCAYLHGHGKLLAGWLMGSERLPLRRAIGNT
jgi:hypothetical protein